MKKRTILLIATFLITAFALKAQVPLISISKDNSGNTKTFLAGKIDVSDNFQAFENNTFTCTPVQPLRKGDVIAAKVADDQGWSANTVADRFGHEGVIVPTDENKAAMLSAYPVIGMVKYSDGDFRIICPAVLKLKVNIAVGQIIHSDGYQITVNRSMKAGESIPVLSINGSMLSVEAVNNKPSFIAYKNGAYSSGSAVLIEVWRLAKKHVGSFVENEQHDEQATDVQKAVDFRSKQPKAGPAPILSLKDPVIYKMPNGITVLVVEDHRLPKVSATFFIDAGPVTSGSKTGVMSIMGSMLNEGTKTMPKATFDEAVEKLGADVSLNSSGGSASALTRYFKNAFTLMGQALKEPAFTQESFDKIKTQTVTGLKSQSKSAAAIAERVTGALTYGKTHPNGEFATEEGIQALTLQDVKNTYAKYITPSRSYLTIVGDIKPLDAKILATKVFGAWKGRILTLPKLAIVANPVKTEIDVVDVPSAVQAEVKVVNLVSIKKSDPDYFASLLANYVLGGGAESHLFMDLREKHALTYGAYSSMGSNRYQSTFTAYASVRTAKADSAVTELLKEINRMRTEKVSAEELKNAKSLYNGSFALGLEDPARTATFASNILINNLPPDFYKTYLQKVNAVTADDILRVSKKYMNYDNTRIVVVGNASPMLPDLKKKGYPVKIYDKYAEPVVEGAQAKAPDVKAADVIKNYLDAMGGVAELKKVTSYDATMTLAMQGMKLNVSQKKLAPNKEVMSISMGANVLMKENFDGNGGYQMQMGKKTDMTADEIAQKKVFTTITEQLDYLTNPAFKLVVKGIQKVNGEDAYQVAVTDPTGKTSTEYYDVKSKLLVKNENSTTTNNVTVAQTLEYADYRKVGGILFPYKQTLTVSTGGQDQVLVMAVTDVKLNTGVTADDFK